MIVFTLLQMSEAAGRTQGQKNPSGQINGVASFSKSNATANKNDDVYNAPSTSNTCLSPTEIPETKNASGFSQADVEEALRENILVGPVQQVRSTSYVFYESPILICFFLSGKILVLRR